MGMKYGADGADERLVNVREAAARLGLAVSTIYCLVSARRIRFVKIGRRTLFRPQDLDKLIEAGVVEPRAAA